MSPDNRSFVTRRRFISATAAVAAVAVFPRQSGEQAPSGPFKLDPQHLREQRAPHRRAHHGDPPDRHHAAYVTNLNNAVKDHWTIARCRCRTFSPKLGEMPEAIRTVLRNNGSQPTTPCFGR